MFDGSSNGNGGIKKEVLLNTNCEPDEYSKLDLDIKKPEVTLEDDTSIVDDEDSGECCTLVDTFKFERGLKLILEIPKETIRYKYNEKLDKHIQLPSLISFRDLCINAYGEENVIEKKTTENKRKWDNIIKEKSIDVETNDKDENEENERTYEDITSFLDTIKSNNKQDFVSPNENVLRKRVHEMSTRLSKQGLLCDPREYYFNPMTMTGGNAINKSREDYYDVYDDFIDDSELVDDLGLSLEELYNRNENNDDSNFNDDNITTTSIQTSELIYADYKNPDAFYCDDNPQNDLIDFYYEASSISSEELNVDENEYEINAENSSQDIDSEKRTVSIRDILNNPVIKLLTQLKTDCWCYYSPKLSLTNKDLNENNFNHLSTPTVDNNQLQVMADLNNIPTKESNFNLFTFPQRTPKVVTEWFKMLNQKLKSISDSYTRCKSYYINYGNIKYEKNFLKPEIQDPLLILISNIERDPILCKIPSLFSSIYKDYKDVVPFDSKLIQLIWEALNKSVPMNNRKVQFNINNHSTSSNAIIQLLTKFENFRLKWARLILNHNQEALYQFDLNAYESIINYPLIKNKSPIYIKQILDAIAQYNSSINNTKSQDSNDNLDNICDSSTPLNIILPLENEDQTNYFKASEKNELQIQQNLNIDLVHNSAQNGNQSNVEISGFQNQDQNRKLEKAKTKNQDLVSQTIKAINCDLVFDYGVSLLEYIHGINRLRLVYKDMLSANVMQKAIQKEQENIPVNGTKGLELMIKNYILKRFSNVNFEGQKIKEIPHRFFLNQVKLLQLKYNYKSLTSITVRRPKNEFENKDSKRSRKDNKDEDPNTKTEEKKVNSPNKICSEKNRKRIRTKSPIGPHLSEQTDQLGICLTSSLEINKPKSKPRKSKKTVMVEDDCSAISLSDISVNSQQYSVETPHLEMRSIQPLNEGIIAAKEPRCKLNEEPKENYIENERIVERLCDLHKMTSHTINDIYIESTSGVTETNNE